MANVRAVSPSTEDIVTGRLRCFSDWLQVANHLHFDGEADITTTPYDILVDEHLLAQYTTLYNRPGTQAGCAVAFLVLNHFFTRIALNECSPTAIHLTPALRAKLTNPRYDAVTTTRRRLVTCNKRKRVERYDERVLAGKRAKIPDGLTNAAHDSDYDTLLLMTLLHIGTPQSPAITNDCAQLLQDVFCVVFQLTYPQRPEILRNLVLGSTVMNGKGWNVDLRFAASFKTGGHHPALDFTLEHQTGILGTLLIEYALPNRAAAAAAVNPNPPVHPPLYLIATARTGKPYTSSSFATHFKQVCDPPRFTATTFTSG